MNILVVNSGSSSLKFSFFAEGLDHDDPHLLLEGELSNKGTPSAALTVTRQGQPLQKLRVEIADSAKATISLVLDTVASWALGEIDAVGYRVVHPGATIRGHIRLSPDVLQSLVQAAEFAPLHDPGAVDMIRAAMILLPSLPHFACFDTVFHQTMPAEASTYAIPALYRELGVKRYGFHGLSCESVIRQLLALGPLPRRMVIAHLGSGCSVTAVADGASIDTSMGLTPTGGVVMGTRPGDLDPGLLLFLMRQQAGNDKVGSLETMLNHEAGMVALSGLPNDMKAVRSAADNSDPQATLALKIFTRAIQKTIGGFSWLMGGLDAIAFTGGIGEHDADTRSDVLLGSQIAINSSLNHTKLKVAHPISASESSTAVFVVPAQENLVIALHVRRMVRADG